MGHLPPPRRAKTSVAKPRRHHPRRRPERAGLPRLGGDRLADHRERVRTVHLRVRQRRHHRAIRRQRIVDDERSHLVLHHRVGHSRAAVADPRRGADRRACAAPPAVTPVAGAHDRGGTGLPGLRLRAGFDLRLPAVLHDGDPPGRHRGVDVGTAAPADPDASRGRPRGPGACAALRIAVGGTRSRARWPSW